MPQSVSVKPRRAGICTNALSSPAVISTATNAAAIQEKRRTASIWKRLRSAAPAVCRVAQSTQTITASVPIQPATATRWTASKSVPQIQPRSIAAPWLTLANVATRPAPSTSSPRAVARSGSSSNGGVAAAKRRPRRTSTPISSADAASRRNQRTCSQVPLRVSKRTSSRKPRSPSFSAAEAAS